jgi:two-component system, cell cycle sensor histidine kinase and response regulator CckA
MVNLVPKTYTSRLKDFIGRRTTPTGLTPDDGIRYWQERLLLVFIFIGTVLGLFVYLPSVALSIKEGLWSVAVADTIIYAWIVILFFRRSIPFAVRAVTVSLISYILGMVLLLTIGPFGGGPVWLFAFPVMVAILLGLRISLMALAVNAGTLIIIGILLQFSIMQWDYSATNPVEKWLVISLNFLLLNSIVTISIALISGGIQGLLKRQKSMLASLEKSEEKFRVLFEFAPDAYYLNDFQGTFIDGNRTAEELLGYKKEALIGKNFLELNLLSPDQLPKALELLGKNLEGKETGPDEFILNPKSGEPVVVEIRTLPTEIDGQNIILGIARDVSKRKQLETSLHQAQKMEAIGMLAGGVAHDLNNILGGLVSYPELLLLQLPKDSPLRKPILTIQKSGEKAAAVVQDLLTLARRGVVVTEVVKLNDVIVEYLKSLEFEKLQSYYPAVHLEAHLEKNVLNILGSSIHLSKTVMNMVSNAAEAMPEGGALTVSTENRYIDRPITGYEDVVEGDYVVLTIADTGTGIALDDIEKIFEPFYTKKKMGRSGTGLGMAVVWGTVKDHNGYIDVKSTEGEGTTFTLYFPVTRKELPEDKSHLAIESYSGNGESILIVDDVEEQRNIASGMLEELGYSVVSVSSGEEAVEYLKTNKVDLLVLDMIMDPGMDGLDTYKKIIEIHPGQKAIIASGFSETDRAKELQSLGAGAYIKKPFLLEKIGIAVKKELEK